MKRALGSLLIIVACGAAQADEHVLHRFERQQLTDVYYSEGIAAGDINRDGHVDVVYGPYWFEGPEFRKKHEIYPATPQPRERYADHFFAWVYDFNGDGWNDVFAVGFPGTPAYVYENPGGDQLDQLWKKHQVFDSVANESPHFTNLVGDERPELVCTNKGHFGFATIDWENPLQPWTFHAVSERIAHPTFGHGLGVGDVNGDGRLDILHAKGWFEQPADPQSGELWTAHEASFTDSYGGAEMHCYDVDGDGDNDVITSLAAHDFGLAWYEQIRDADGRITFRQHRILGDRPEHNRYGLVFSELHSVTLADMDGDGLKDIVTGKTYWSHHRQSPMWDAGAVVYWFRLVRTADGVDWVPYKADGEAGIGRQVVVSDLNGDKLPDIIAGGMKGAHVLLHRTRGVDAATWRDAQPKPYDGPATSYKRGEPSPIDEQTGRVPNALEGEALKVQTTAGRISVQKMSGFRKDHWSGDAQLFWTGAKPGDRLRLEVPVDEAGKYTLGIVLTTARDYAVVRLLLDGEPLGEAIDLYDSPDVMTTGLLEFGELDLAAGKHELTIEITGANPAAVKAYLVGLDYLRLTRVKAPR